MKLGWLFRVGSRQASCSMLCVQQGRHRVCAATVAVRTMQGRQASGSRWHSVPGRLPAGLVSITLSFFLPGYCGSSPVLAACKICCAGRFAQRCSCPPRCDTCHLPMPRPCPAMAVVPWLACSTDPEGRLRVRSRRTYGIPALM